MPPRGKANRPLSTRALNRAALARQMLLRREKVSVLDGIERLVALQAQLPNPPYVGLWTRLVDFERDDLTTLIEKRRVVRSTMMRATQHLVTAELLDAGRAMLEERPHTITELKAGLAERWPKHEPNALGYSVQMLLPP